MSTAVVDDRAVVEPAPAEPMAAVPAAVVAVPVPVPAAPVEEPERELARLTPSMFSRYPFRCLAYVLLTVACLAAAGWAFATSNSTVGLVLVLCGLAVASRFAFWWMRMAGTLILITTRKVRIESGVWRREGAEIPLKDITSVHVEQGPLLSVMGVGDVMLTCDGGTKRQAALMGVPAPAAVAAVIQGGKAS